MDVVKEFFEKTEGFLEKPVAILKKRNNIYNEPKVIGEKIIIRQNNVIIIMLAETIKLLRKSLERIVRNDNDLEELIKRSTNLKITKKSRSPFVT